MTEPKKKHQKPKPTREFGSRMADYAPVITKSKGKR